MQGQAQLTVIGDSMNKIKLYINGQDYSNNVPFPFKWQELLDEQLDEGSFSLLQVTEKVFKPLTDVKVIITNESNKTLKEIDFLVSNDKAEEIPSGSGKYNHEIYVIELTKWLEGFMCRSVGFVNSISRYYADKTWNGNDI